MSAQTDLALLFRSLPAWVEGIANTQVKRIGAAITEAVTNRRSLSEARDEIEQIVHDQNRAEMIAETEFSRAHSEAALSVYRASIVEMVVWLPMPGACPQCLENAAASPQPITSPNWPNGPLPVHPHERCVLAPYG